MNCLRLVGIGLFGTLVAGAVARAEVTDAGVERYKLFIDRNPFNLVDPPPQVVVLPPTNPVAPPLQLKLSGLSSGPRGKQAWLQVPPSPGQTNGTQHWKVREGEQQGDVKVIEINLRERTVKLMNAGVTAVLDLAKDSPQPQGPAVMPGGVPGRPGMVPGRPGAIPAIPTPNRPTVGRAGRPGGVPSSARMSTQPGLQQTLSAPGVQSINVNALQGGGPSDIVVGGPGVATSLPGVRTVPARPIRTDTTPPEVQDAAAQWLLMQAQKTLAEQEGIPFPPPPPPPE